MMRRLRTQKRLESLEARWHKPETQAYREAFIVSEPYDGETHLVMDSDPGAPRCYFHKERGPGPQLPDFGQFELVLYLTPDEMKL
jgi:hypothetical protein